MEEAVKKAVEAAVEEQNKIKQKQAEEARKEIEAERKKISEENDKIMLEKMEAFKAHVAEQEKI